ncbi:MAG: hypothetical protein MHM6MM_000434 [Cercozoa sp. M6MM]
MASSKIKAAELRSKSKEELLKQLNDLRQELQTLRVAKVAGGAQAKVSKIGVVRKNIARVLTIYNQAQKDARRNYFKKSKYLPLDLRAKGTRSYRRKLSEAQLAKQTLRQQKKELHFGIKKYALKA